MTNATISFSNHILSAEWKHFFLINEKTRIVSKVIPLVIWVFSLSLLIAKKKFPFLIIRECLEINLARFQKLTKT